MGKCCRLVVFLRLFLRREKGRLSIWNAKKTTSSAWRSSRKKLPQHATRVAKKNCALHTFPRSAAAVFLYRFFFLVSFFLSFFPFFFASFTTTTTTPSHVMMHIRIRNPFCCVVLDGDINSVRKRQIIRSKVQIDKTSHLSIVNLRSFISMKT